MAGFYKLFSVGEDGWDGMNPIYYQILVGTSDRMSLEPRYFDNRFRPLGRVKVIVPPSPDHPDILLDACIAFSPIYFESCPSLGKVGEALADAKCIDFHLNGYPTGWKELREEARTFFKKITIYESELNKIQGRSLWPGDGWPEFELPKLFEK